MKNIDKILCPVDLSEPSAVALRSAQDLAHRLGAKLLVAHVLDDPAHSVPDRGNEQKSRIVVEYERAAKVKLDEFTASLDRSLPVEVKTVNGAAAETIAKLAEQESCQLIVMGTHGRTGFRHMLLGSVTERVLRIANVPVLVMRATAE